MSSVISKDSTKITYDKKGSGPLLIFVLGALNKRGRGKKLADLLLKNFTVVAYDRRGRGDSTETFPYSINKEVEDLEAIIDELGGKAYLYGHSSGAILALEAASKLGKKVIGVSVYEVPINDDSEYKKVHKEYKTKLLESLNEDDDAEAVSLFVKSVGVSEKQIDAMKKLPMWKGLTGMAHTLLYDTIELIEFYPKIKIENISAPVLIMYGGASPAFMKNTAEKLKHALPKSKLHELEGQNHDVKAEAIAPEILESFK